MLATRVGQSKEAPAERLDERPRLGSLDDGQRRLVPAPPELALDDVTVETGLVVEEAALSLQVEDARSVRLHQGQGLLEGHDVGCAFGPDEVESLRRKRQLLHVAGEDLDAVGGSARFGTLLQLLRVLAVAVDGRYTTAEGLGQDHGLHARTAAYVENGRCFGQSAAQGQRLERALGTPRPLPGQAALHIQKDLEEPRVLFHFRCLRPLGHLPLLGHVFLRWGPDPWHSTRR